VNEFYELNEQEFNTGPRKPGGLGVFGGGVAAVKANGVWPFFWFSDEFYVVVSGAGGQLQGAG